MKQILLLIPVMCVAILGTSAIAAADAERVFIEKEIDDDHIIISRENGDRLLLKKWSLRFSPLLFEGKSFVASVSPMWVTVYFEDRAEIKWSIEERLGSARLSRRSAPGVIERPEGAVRPKASDPTFILLVQGALSLLGLDPGPREGILTEQTRAATREFQRQEKLGVDGTPDQATCLALVTGLYRKYPKDSRALGIASQLLTASDAQSLDPTASPPAADIIESHILGEFKGWDGETVFFLDNAQIWQQASYAYIYHYAYRPKAIIYKTAGGYKMIVEGVSGSIYVRPVK